MNAEAEAIANLKDLKRLSEYCGELLSTEQIFPESLYTRKSYVYSLFIFGLSFVDGITTLAERGQARSIEPLLRGIQEAWIHSMFVYATRSHIWVYYLLLQDELQTMKKRDDLQAKGMGDPGRHKIRNDEAKKFMRAVKRRYEELPLIPQIITKKNQNLETRRLNLKEKCQIIDYYRSLKPTKSKLPRVSQEEHYNTVYGHLSGTPHVTPLALNSLYKYDAEGNLRVDISGGQDRKYISVLLLNAYLYQYHLMKLFIENVSSNPHTIPADIKAARRRMMAFKADAV